MRAVAGALCGAMLGLFVAKELTDRFLILLPCSIAGSIVGILVSFLIPRREDPTPE